MIAKGITPILNVSNLAATFAWFEKWGWRKLWDWGHSAHLRRRWLWRRSALARLQLARAYAMEGDTGKAKSTYQDFLTLWKDADSELPVLIAAKEEYAKLQ